MRTITIAVTQPCKWLATNGRDHWTVKARRATNRPAVWDNRSAPGGATNTLRGLTRSLDLTKEGLT